MLRDVPIRPKLTLLTMTSSLAALLIACIAFTAYEMGIYREGLLEDLGGTADMVAFHAAAALSFNDRRGGTDMLGSLRTKPHIVAAALYDADGALFAEYRRRVSVDRAFRMPRVQPAGHHFAADALELFHSVKLDDEPFGTLYIRSDLEAMNSRLQRYMQIVAIVIGCAALVSFLIAGGLQRLISRPISQLAQVVARVGEGDFSVRAAAAGRDELGRLTYAFNEMLDHIQRRDEALQEARETLEARVCERTSELMARGAELQTRTEELQAEVAAREHAQQELERVHKELMQASRLSGMSEIAANVLHNVGNVLNSLSVSTAMVAKHVDNFGVARLQRVVVLLREHEGSIGEFLSTDPRGQRVPSLLGKLVEHFKAQEATIGAELALLRDNVSHIHEIVITQQSYAKRGGAREIISLTDLVEDSLRINKGALERHRVTLVKDYQCSPMVNLDKHQVLQILVNLLRNAKYACDESGLADRSITLRVSEHGGRARVCVIDNGVGIAPENLTRIFQHGFTTRAEAGGHGFGLHSCALAAQALAGSLIAESAGLGQGATFTLELPVYGEEINVESPAAASTISKVVHA